MDTTTVPQCQGCMCSGNNQTQIIDIEESNVPLSSSNNGLKQQKNQQSTSLRRRPISTSEQINSSSNSSGSSKSTTTNNNNNNNNTTITIEHTVSNEHPLSQSLNTITQSLKDFTEPKASESHSASDLLFNTFGDSIVHSNLKIPLCTCQQSKAYPYCDSTHKQFNHETSSHVSPIYIKFEKQQQQQQQLNSKQHTAEPTSTATTTTTTSNQRHSTDLKSSTSRGVLQSSNGSNNSGSSSSSRLNSSTLLSDSVDSNSESNNSSSNTNRRVKYKPGSIKDTVNQQNYFSLEEIALHNTVDDLWMIIQNKVYDITKYVGAHPGGKNALIRFAGRDGTENVQFHSGMMLKLLNDHYFIGHLQRDQQTVEPSRCLIV
ncbi:hypothetical protein SAMD00019534_010470, partial [Acytostelium subglobosum LB1]|uniref:hypothetical protein n=1 Tax=Acytostelium subglobosum LB1 TaxID=1410327 RepID=UPI000644A695